MNVVVLLSCVMVVAGIPQQRDHLEEPVVLCGRQLARARVLLCYGAEFVNKRTSTNSLLSLPESEDLGDDNELEWPWSDRHAALGAHWSRHKRNGLVDECCLKACTTKEILNYC